VIVRSSSLAKAWGTVNVAVEPQVTATVTVFAAGAADAGDRGTPVRKTQLRPRMRASVPLINDNMAVE
jgi:hypothetical protein